MSLALEIVLLAFLTVAALAILRMRDLFAITMLFSLFSLLSAGLFTVMDAADDAECTARHEQHPARRIEQCCHQSSLRPARSNSPHSTYLSTPMTLMKLINA